MSRASWCSGRRVPWGVAAEGYDTWSGEVARAVVPRILEDTPEKLLGKRGSIRDKHNMARGILEERLRGIRISARSRRASWDELAAVVSLVVRGVLSYAPLVGLPFPSTLHNEDAAFQPCWAQNSYFG